MGARRRVALWLVVAVPWAVAAWVAFGLWRPGAPAPDGLLDFELFRAVGGMVREGRAAEAYAREPFLAALRAIEPDARAAPWAYPPPASFVVAALALGPVWAAYAAFVGVTLAAWQLAVARLAGRDAAVALLAGLPAAVVNAFGGQNGLATAALLGAAVLGARRARTAALGGVALGGLAVKPHLGAMVGAWLVLRGDWRAGGAALGVAALLAGAATWAFGPAIWGAWREALAATGARMADGEYPLARMTSVYAGLRSAGVAPGAALGWHAAVALAGAMLVAASLRERWDARRGAALAVAAGALVSPYLYDYDLALVAVALALALPDLGARARVAAVALAWAAEGWGMACVYGPGLPGLGDAAVFARSLGALPAVAWVALLATALGRAERAGRLRPAARAG